MTRPEAERIDQFRMSLEHVAMLGIAGSATFIHQVLGAGHQLDKALILKRLRDAKRVKAAEGGYVGSSPAMATAPRHVGFVPMTDGFDVDFGVDEWHGTNAFVRDATACSAPTSSTPAATRRLAAPGATSTSPRSAARSSGRTRPRAIPTPPPYRVVELA